MKPAKEWANKFFLDYPSVHESHLIDDKCLSHWFRLAQADALRWAAHVVNENITRDRDGKGNHYTAEETRDMIRHMADVIEVGRDGEDE